MNINFKTVQLSVQSYYTLNIKNSLCLYVCGAACRRIYNNIINVCWLCLCSMSFISVYKYAFSVPLRSSSNGTYYLGKVFVFRNSDAGKGRRNLVCAMGVTRVCVRKQIRNKIQRLYGLNDTASY